MNSTTQPKTVSTVLYSLNVNVAKDMILITVQIKSKTYKAFIDFDSEIAIIKKCVAEELELEIRPYSGLQVRALNGNALKYFGEVMLHLYVVNENNFIHSAVMNALVVDELPADILLSVDTLSKLNILKLIVLRKKFQLMIKELIVF